MIYTSYSVIFQSYSYILKISEKENFDEGGIQMIRYRTETFSGLGERNAAEVMSYETFEMGNVDILETLLNTILKGRGEINEKCFYYMNSINNSGLEGMPTFEEGIKFFQDVLTEIKAVTGHEIKYALWLANLEDVKDKNFYGKYIDSDEDVDAYEIGPVVLSELGCDGTLYGYTALPVCINHEEMR